METEDHKACQVIRAIREKQVKIDKMVLMENKANQDHQDQ